MKKILLIIVVVMLAGCSRYKCYPTKGSRDYATVKGNKVQVWKKSYQGRILISECIDTTIK